jgi:uncharacterized protein (TIGR02145 family)
MKPKLILIFLSSFFILFSSSCKRKGCTDPESNNYKDYEISDNQSCVFEGSAVFYFNQKTSADLQNEGATTITVFLEDENIGSIPSSSYLNSVAFCGQAGGISVTKDLGFEKKKSYKYSVRDQRNNEYWSGFVTLNPKKCESIQINFETNDAVFTFTEGAGVTDIDNNNYTTINYGNGQVWMAQNLKVTRYNNGDSINHVTDAVQWRTLTSGAWANYENNALNGIKFGKLYNWYAVNDSRKLCPSGWRIPSDDDWNGLTDYLGGNAVAGGNMKTRGTVDWALPNAGANNNSAFSALPAGQRLMPGNFNDKSVYCFWWSSGEYNEFFGRYIYVFYGFGNTFKNHKNKKYGISVRCIKD